MKKFFKPFNYVLFLVAIVASLAAVGFGQDPCEDSEGKSALDAKFRELYAKRDFDSRAQAISAGKEFLEKYGSCEDVKAFVDYLKVNVPKMEERLKSDKEKARTDELLKKFDTGLKAKNWDAVYDAGKQLLADKPDDYRAAELVLGSIGLDETAKSPRITKWNEETLRFAKQSLQDLESGKEFKSYGVDPYSYKDRNDAIGWMNYTIGYIYVYDRNNKKEALPYLYKASQASSTTKDNPVVFETIASYYFDEANKLINEIKALPQPADTDTEEMRQQKVDTLKGKIGILNGTTERAMDAFGRAYKLAPSTEAGKGYKQGLMNKLTQLYDVRFNKQDGLTAWIDNTVSKPMPNPTTPITPVNDPDPDATSTGQSGSTSTSTTTPPISSPMTKPVQPVAKPMPAGPTTKPGTGTKPQSSVKGANGTAPAATTVAKTNVKRRGTR